MLFFYILPKTEGSNLPLHLIHSPVQELMRSTGFCTEVAHHLVANNCYYTRERACGISYREAVLCFTLTVHIDADSVEIFHFLTGCNRPGSRHRAEITMNYCESST